MKDVGLYPIAVRIADAVLDVAKGKKGQPETKRRIIAAALPLLAEAVEIGLDQATIAVAERHRELKEQA